MHLSLAAVIAAASSAATAYASASKAGKQSKTQSFSKGAKSAYYSTSMSMSVGPNPPDKQGDAFNCTSTSIFLNLLDVVSDAVFTIAGVSTAYTTYDAYKSSEFVFPPDGRFSFKTVEDGFSCQGSAMLSLDGSLGGPNNQIYASSVCDPTPAGGITAGFGDFAGATGIMEYEVVSANVGEVKFHYCLPIGLNWET